MDILSCIGTRLRVLFFRGVQYMLKLNELEELFNEHYKKPKADSAKSNEKSKADDAEPRAAKNIRDFLCEWFKGPKYSKDEVDLNNQQDFKDAAAFVVKNSAGLNMLDIERALIYFVAFNPTIGGGQEGLFLEEDYLIDLRLAIAKKLLEEPFPSQETYENECSEVDPLDFRSPYLAIIRSISAYAYENFCKNMPYEVFKKEVLKELGNLTNA